MRSSHHAAALPRLALQLAIVSGCVATQGVHAETVVDDLADMSLQELTNIQVTTLSKRPQRAIDVAAALFVLTQDDIRRSGATTIPEALRMVPGLQVASIDGNKSAVSSRGFNGRFANKLLVLMDGRTLYTPSFGGVSWDVQDTLIDDIERIEVIRGPAGTAWGSNAVNGIINIITKHADQTDGLLLNAEAGLSGSESVNVRFGEANSGDTRWRVYGKAFDRAGNDQRNGAEAYDTWQQQRIGFRTDTAITPSQTVRTSAEAYQGESGDSLSGTLLIPIANPYAAHIKGTEQVDGVWASAGWARQLESDGKVDLQVYFDHSARTGTIYGERRDTADVDFQHVLPRMGSNTLTWGAGLRNYADYFAKGEKVALTVRPQSFRFLLSNAYVQDELGLFADRLTLTVGARVEHAELGGTAVLPNVRAQVAIDDHSVLWAAIGRGVRRPSRGERDLYAPHTIGPIPAGVAGNLFPLPLTYDIIGDDSFRSEKLTAYETGWRWQTGKVSIDASIFFNDYTRLRSGALIAPACMPGGVSVLLDPSCVAGATSIVVGGKLNNRSSGQTQGGELTVTWAPATQWRLMGTYSHIDKQLEGIDPSDPVLLFSVGQDPRNEYGLRSTSSIGPRWDWDVFAKYRDSVSASNLSGYTELNTRIAWRPKLDLEIAIVGRNLFNSGNIEAVSEFLDLGQIAIARTGYLQARWSYR